MKIYLDYIFLENLVVNTVIILELIKFTKSKVSTKREVLIIIIDTILSCIFAIYSNFSSYILHFLVSIVILFFLFNPKNIYELIKKFCYYYLLYFIYIGIVISFSILFKINLENIINKLCIYGISAIFFHFLCKDLWKMWKINITDRDLFYTLCINGKRISAFVDTGNSVKDPATSLDVIFLKECLKEEIITKDMKPTITYINVSTVNGSEIKIGYIIKNITVYKEKREIALIDKIILSFSLDNSNTPEKYSAILGYDTYLENLKGVIL